MKLIVSVILLAAAGSLGLLAAVVGYDRANPDFRKVESGANGLVPVSQMSLLAEEDETPDGDATVYLLDEYAKPFDLVYTIRLTLKPKNASWSTLGIMLIGTENPGPSIQVGMAQENATTIKVFTTIGSASGADEYNGYPLACVPDCEIELHGDDDSITALASGQVIGKWPRADVPLQNPYAQINGEVHGAHDAIDGSVTLKRAFIGTMEAKPPTCAYTRGGIAVKALPHDRLAFSGTRNDGTLTYYYSIIDGRRGADCSEITAPSPRPAPGGAFGSRPAKEMARSFRALT